MTEQDIAAQLEASMSAVHGAFDRVKQAVVDNDTLAALEGMADAILSVAKFADAAAKAVEVVGQQRDVARAEVDRLQAEVDRLRAWMPKWRRGPFGVTLWSLGVPNGDQRFDVWRYASQWFWGAANSTGTPATDRDAAMRAAEAAAWLPQCEVAE